MNLIYSFLWVFFFSLNAVQCATVTLTQLSALVNLTSGVTYDPSSEVAVGSAHYYTIRAQAVSLNASDLDIQVDLLNPLNRVAVYVSNTSFAVGTTDNEYLFKKADGEKGSLAMTFTLPTNSDYYIVVYGELCPGCFSGITYDITAEVKEMITVTSPDSVTDVVGFRDYNRMLLLEVNDTAVSGKDYGVQINMQLAPKSSSESALVDFSICIIVRPFDFDANVVLAGYDSTKDYFNSSKCTFSKQEVGNTTWSYGVLNASRIFVIFQNTGSYPRVLEASFNVWTREIPLLVASNSSGGFVNGSVYEKTMNFYAIKYVRKQFTTGLAARLVSDTASSNFNDLYIKSGSPPTSTDFDRRATTASVELATLDRFVSLSSEVNTTFFIGIQGTSCNEIQPCPSYIPYNLSYVVTSAFNDTEMAEVSESTQQKAVAIAIVGVILLTLGLLGNLSLCMFTVGLKYMECCADALRIQTSDEFFQERAYSRKSKIAVVVVSCCFMISGIVCIIVGHNMLSVAAIDAEIQERKVSNLDLWTLSGDVEAQIWIRNPNSVGADIGSFPVTLFYESTFGSTYQFATSTIPAMNIPSKGATIITLSAKVDLSAGMIPNLILDVMSEQSVTVRAVGKVPLKLTGLPVLGGFPMTYKLNKVNTFYVN